MKFDSLSDFLNMGGYGFYVWSVYGVALLIFIVLFVAPKLKSKALINQIKDLKLREDL